jgi:hypothetical protein
MPQMQLYDAPQVPSVNTFINPLMDGFKRGDELRQQGFKNDRAMVAEGRQGEQLQLAKNADARAASSAADVQKDRMTKNFGNMMLAIVNEPDEAKAQSYWQRIKTMPDFAREAAAAGYDLNDHRGTSRLLAAKAGVLPDPLDRRAKMAEITGAEGRASMIPLQREGLELDVRGKRQALEQPKIGTADIGPDHSRVFYDPKTGQEVGRLQGPPKGLDSTSRKAIYEAQDELPNLKSAVDQLEEAKALLPKIYTGYLSGIRSSFNQGAPGILPNIISSPESAKATQRYNQIMGAEAVGAMSQTLKGATTDNEMRVFVNLINDPNVASDVKVLTIDRMLQKARAFQRNKEDRIRELGGRMPGDGSPRPGPGGPAGGVADPLGIR